MKGVTPSMESTRLTHNQTFTRAILPPSFGHLFTSHFRNVPSHGGRSLRDAATTNLLPPCYVAGRVDR